jgi:serine/threonine protein kinase
MTPESEKKVENNPYKNLANELLKEDSSLFSNSNGIPTESDSGDSTKIIINETTVLDRDFCKKYKILNKLGEGGMGVAFLAEDQENLRKVVVKFMKATSPELEIRFFREIRSLSKIESHPYIIKILDFGYCKLEQEEKKVPFYFMEYSHGATLESLRFQLSLREKVEIIVKLTEALHYIHEQNIIHRDIKPGNILIHLPEATPKLLDFGLSRILGETQFDISQLSRSRLTLDRELLGTFDYMSPEQVENVRLAHKQSDIYSLGYVLYVLLTGKSLNQGNSLYEAYKTHGDRERLRQNILDDLQKRTFCFNNNIDLELQQICRHALEIDLKKRYQTMSDFGQALSVYLKKLSERDQWLLHFIWKENEASPQKLENFSYLVCSQGNILLESEISEGNYEYGQFLIMGNECSLEILNPLEVNGKELNAGESHPLREGDQLQIKDSLFFYKKACSL